MGGEGVGRGDGVEVGRMPPAEEVGRCGMEGEAVDVILEYLYRSVASWLGVKWANLS